MANTYEYIDKSGKMASIEATSPEEAFKLAPDIGTSSGVSFKNNPITTTKNETLKDTTTEPTVGDFQMPTFDNSYENTFNDYYKGLDFNEDKVRRNVINQFQGQIDATKRSYSQLLGEVKQQGAGRLGEDVAMQSRRGLLGSDFGSAQTEKVRSLNLSKEEQVRAAEAAAISDIMALAQGAAREEIAARRLAKQKGTTDYLNYLSTAEDRRTTKLTNLANALLLQNVDPTTLDKTQLSTIAKGIGATEADIINSYLSTKRTQESAEAERQAQLQKELSFNLSEGQARYQYNPETGQVEQVAYQAKTYKPTGSTVYNGKVLTSSQKTAVDNLDAVESSLNSYKQLYNQLVGKSGVNLTGQDAGQLAGAYNALIFQIAQAAGTGALQAADREVVEAMIPNPTTISGAVGGAIKGGKAGGIKAIDEAQTIFRNKRNAILGETPSMTTPNQSVKQQVEAAGYDYEAMKADGLSDQEILNSL